MTKNLFRPFTNQHTEKLSYLKYGTIGKHKSAYFDYTASGLAFRAVENRIYDMLTTYANTHSKESGMANQTHNYYEEALDNLKVSLELNDDFEVIPSGCGSTAAIKRFQELLGLYIPPATKRRLNINIDKSKLPLVIVGPYEHHSNEISYREAMCETARIGLTSEGLVDIEELEKVLKDNQDRELIGSFCIASNVTGIVTCYKEISNILRRYNAIVCLDAAASSSYMNIDCNYFDVMYLSPHKLLGGPGSCGLLVIKKDLIDPSLSPTFAGGGTVSYVSRTTVEYEDNLRARETAGTPGIIQVIKASLAYQLRNEIGFDFILKRKDELLSYFLIQLEKVPNIIIYGNQKSYNIGIVSFNIKDLDPYMICENISTNSGIQTRAGCSCAGPYGHDLLDFDDKDELDKKPGWIRVSIHYTQTKEEIDNLIEAINSSIKTIIKN
ncbi:MAG: aminotransferase class V-fold PLP-dependent enzyme [Arcobacter sp.]|uniref:aminotransferase class V-fold PLP-dependent enzyme n=1 Tax=Arcobacter sp. TaxID=1872629 RepID=UPI003AFFA8B8